LIGFKSDKVLQAVNAMHVTIPKSVKGTLSLKDFILLVLESLEGTPNNHLLVCAALSHGYFILLFISGF
jgi:hypothetical protein